MFKDNFKVVETDNFGGDYPNEKFATPYSFTRFQARGVAELFNSMFGGEHAPRYWKVVELPYELQPGFEP